MTSFRAPWSKSLIVASTFAALVCLGVSYALWTLPLTGGPAESLRFWLALLPLAVILICGYFRNKELGSYRAFMTNRRRAVVLRFPSSVIVVSPDRPEDFVSTISQYKMSS